MKPSSKCRVWDREGHRMIHNVQFVTFTTKGTGWFRNGEICHFGPGENDNPLMFHIGLQDKYGKDIYDGDILKQELHQLGNKSPQYRTVVQYIYGVVEWGYCGFYCMKRKGPKGSLSLDMEASEIIGNIYENPALATGINERVKVTLIDTWTEPKRGDD